MSEFEQVRDGVEGEASVSATAPAPGAAEASVSAVAPGPGAAEAGPRGPETPVAAAMRELQTLDGRDLAEHPDVYQRIHAELQSALATIDNA